MRLSDLAREVPGTRLEGGSDPELTAVVFDSRGAAPGVIFVAVPGLKADGHDYLGQAISLGAAAVVVQADREPKWRETVAQNGIPRLVVAHTRVALASIAAVLAGHPGRRIGVIGVTGTDGKTSLSHLIDHILRSSGEPCGLISTAECRVGARPLIDTGRFTTPEAPELQAMLAEIADTGCHWAIIEATSHGLAQHRIDGSEFDIGVVTSVGTDHLDFHGTSEAYLAAKGRLFEMLGESAQKGIEKTAVLNADDPAFDYFKSLSHVKRVAYGLSGGDIRGTDVREEGRTSRFVVEAGGAAREFTVPRPGLFNVCNALAATGVCLTVGLDLDRIGAGVASWPGAPGRMEFIDEGQNFTVIVDFAHAPDSLRRVLELLRTRYRGRIIAVFGSIGERERDRRAAMGKVAAETADFVVVTDDNPYTEDRETILRDIAAGLTAAGKRAGHDFAVIADRREAIAHALGMAVDEDAVLLAGKGHEKDVHLADGVYECDDREVARYVLREVLRA